MSQRNETSLQFLGGVETVTGSRFLVSTDRSRILIDCGLFQGERALRERNWTDPPFDPNSIDGVLLSHAHLDHSGYLPVLVRRGFRGPIHATYGTRDLLDVLLHDSARIEEEEAAHANRKGYSRHRPALALFDSDDVERALRQVVPHRYHDEFMVTHDVRANFRRAGHILGSAIVQLSLPNGIELADTGDLGRWNQPILRDPDLVQHADVVLIESTYGDRVHARDAVERLVTCIRDAVARGGPVLIPAFAVGRTQFLIWTLRELEEAGRIPSLPVYIDSPMANRVSEVTCKHLDDLDHEMRRAMEEKRCPLCCKQYKLVATKEESIALNDLEGAFIVIAGSGMISGGRILHHLRRRLPDARTTVLLTGFQPTGTRGRQLLDGAQFLRIHGIDVRVNARVEIIDGLSAHADRNELLHWLAQLKEPPKQVYVIHGEREAAESLKVEIRRRFGWNADVARDAQRVVLSR